jgi:hypothetical protein
LSGTGATVDVIAYDAAGNSRMAEVNVKVASGASSPPPLNPVGPDTTPPSVTITYPLSGIRMNRGTKTNITASASDNIGVAVVKTYVNGSLLCQQSSAPYSCPWTVGNTGKVQIQVTALDSAGNTGATSVTVFTR